MHKNGFKMGIVWESKKMADTYFLTKFTPCMHRAFENNPLKKRTPYEIEFSTNYSKGL